LEKMKGGILERLTKQTSQDGVGQDGGTPPKFFGGSIKKGHQGRRGNPGGALDVIFQAGRKRNQERRLKGQRGGIHRGP